MTEVCMAHLTLPHTRISGTDFDFSYEWTFYSAGGGIIELPVADLDLKTYSVLKSENKVRCYLLYTTYIYSEIGVVNASKVEETLRVTES